MSSTALAIDLLDVMPEDTAELEILKPGGLEPSGWIITFAGPGHPKAIAWGKESSRKTLLRNRQIEQAQINGKKFKPEDREGADVLRDNVAWVVARIVDWTPITVGGDPIPFSETAATELLMLPKMGWAYGQMAEFLADERSFTKGSGKASGPMPQATSAFPPSTRPATPYETASKG